MTKVSVSHEPGNADSMSYRAVAGRTQALGRTAGEALDALAAQLAPEDAETLVIVRDLKPDRFFSSEQRRRLAELVALRREVLAGRARWDREDAAELELLVDAELQAAAERARNLVRDLGQ
jgi:hypothetical protein